MVDTLKRSDQESTTFIFVIFLAQSSLWLDRTLRTLRVREVGRRLKSRPFDRIRRAINGPLINLCIDSGGLIRID